MKNKGKSLQQSVRYILLLVLPLSMLFFILFNGYEKTLEKQAGFQVQAAQARSTLIISNQIEAVFSQFISDLLVVHSANELEFYVQNPSKETLLDLALLFVRITNQKEYILRQRFLDETGKELIRVIRKPGNFVSISSESALQDLSESDLYSQTRGHAPRVLYISKVKNEGDSNHFITLALPVYQGSRFFGIVALDFDACYLFSFLFNYVQSLSRDFPFLLIDAEGSVLLTDRDACAEIYKRDENIFSADPSLKEVVFQAPSGSKLLGKTVYTYQAIIPRLSERISWAPGPVRLWTLISYYPIRSLSLLSEDTLLSRPYLKYILTIMFFILGSSVIWIYRIRYGDKQQMRISAVVADYSINGIVVCDPEGRITFCNQVFEQMCGLHQKEMIGHRLIKIRDNTVIEISSGVYPAWILHKDKNYYLMTLTERSIENKQNRVEHTIEIYSPSRWQPKDYIQLAQTHNYDILHHFKTVARFIEQQKPLACLNFKVQNSKEIGMQLNQGERVLLSQNLCATLVSLSSTPFSVYCFSFDSYILFLHNVKPTEALASSIENMLRYFDDPYQLNWQYLHIKMVCGASFYPSTGRSPLELLRCSTLAATQTKPQRTVFYSEDILRLYQRQDSIRKAIPALFSSDQLKLAFQAQLSVTSGKIIGCEALIRWTHPVLGPVRPDEFIPLLKDLGMLDKLGRFVITQAIQFLQRNGARLRLLSPSFSLSINLSAEELANAALIDLLGASLREQRIAENLLTVELTEFSAVESFQKANSVFDKLHAQGVSIAIDDFGTGFSSLSYLLELSSDKIKIDRSFIARYPDAESITIYKTVMLLAKELGATVLAEGVENQEQLDFLSSIGCDEYQGYYFSAAVDEEIFLKQIEQKNG